MSVRAPVAVTLTPRTAADADALFPLLADPALYAFLDEPPPVSVGALRERFARSESRRSPDGREQWLNWVVRDAAGQVAGCVQATIEESGDTNIAYVLGRAFEGRGIAGAAVAQMLALIEAAPHRVRRCHVVVDRRNARSIRLAERLGFVPAPAEFAARRAVAAGDLLMQRRR